jgi:F-type H+-transporting ATPase subunit delta
MTNVAKRYAQALMDLTSDGMKLKVINRDMQNIKKLIDESKEFRLFLHSPVVSKEKKERALSSIFGKKVDPVSLQFLLLLVHKNRENILRDIIETFCGLRDEKLGIVNVRIKTAVKLTKPQEERLLRHFEAYTKKKAKASFTIDKSINGGFIVQIGDTVLDSSIKRQLELLRQKFAEGVTAVDH